MQGPPCHSAHTETVKCKEKQLDTYQEKQNGLLSRRVSGGEKAGQSALLHLKHVKRDRNSENLSQRGAVCTIMTNSQANFSTE